MDIYQTGQNIIGNRKVLTLVVFYCLAFGVGRSVFTLLYVFFMRPIDIGGFGKSIQFRNNQTWITLVTSILILGISSKLTKTSFSKKVFVITILTIQIVSFTSMPFLDLLVQQDYPGYSDTLLDLYGITYQLTSTFNQSLYTPLVKSFLNELITNP
jgi:hypothetical protein